MSVYIMLVIAWGAGLMALLGGFIAHSEGSANTVLKKRGGARCYRVRRWYFNGRSGFCTGS